MDKIQYIKNLSVPKGKIDVVLDTDTFNEVDDQFAMAYMLKSPELNPIAINAAPFFNTKSENPQDGMEKSYNEIMHILELAERDELKNIVYRGSKEFLKDEMTPVISPAAENICRLASEYTPEKPLYIVAIAAITNVASALLIKPEIKDNIVVVWLGGHAWHVNDTFGVVSEFTISKPELEYWLYDKNPLADYLARNAVMYAEGYAAGKPWTRAIWDVTAVAWLLNRDGKFMRDTVESMRLPGYDGKYCPPENDKEFRYVTMIHRDALMEDLINKLTDY